MLTVVFLLFVSEPNNMREYTLRPDPRTLFLYPINRQEYVHNLQTVAAVCQRLNVPVYLQPSEFLDNYQPQFLLQQLYYLYCSFKDAQPIIPQPQPGQ